MHSTWGQHTMATSRAKRRDFLIPNEGSAGYRRDSWGSTDLLLMKEKREKRGSIFMVIIKDPAPSPTSAGWRREGGQTVTGSMCQSSSHSFFLIVLAPLAPHLFEFIEEKYYFIFIDFPFLHTFFSPLSVLIYCSTPFRPLKNNRIFPVQSDYTLFQPFGEL